jgi:hypothetical protein
MKDNKDDGVEEDVPLARRRRSSSAPLDRTESHGGREVNEPRPPVEYYLKRSISGAWCHTHQLLFSELPRSPNSQNKHQDREKCANKMDK